MRSAVAADNALYILSRIRTDRSALIDTLQRHAHDAAFFDRLADMGALQEVDDFARHLPMCLGQQTHDAKRRAIVRNKPKELVDDTV